MTKMSNGMTRDIPTGQVEITPHKGGEWFLVQIGRGRYTKRFNISRAEAEQLLSELASAASTPAS